MESDIVRIGDMVENAGTAAQIAIYRSPDLGTTGTLPTAQVINALQAHQVIGVDTRDIKSVSVTRLARILDGKEIESQVAHALEHRSGLGDAANLSLTFDRDVQDVRLDAWNNGNLQAVAVRYEPRSGRFDVSFEIANETNNTRTKLRFTGIAVEMLEAAVLTRNVERGDVLKASDVVIERRPKAEVGSDAAARGHAVGMQMRQEPSRRPAAAGGRSRQAGPGAARRQCHADLRSSRDLPHLARQGRRKRHRRRHGHRAQPAIQAHRLRHRYRPRTRSPSPSPSPRLPAAETTSSIGAADTQATVSVASRNTAQTTSNAE